MMREEECDGIVANRVDMKYCYAKLQGGTDNLEVGGFLEKYGFLFGMI